MTVNKEIFTTTSAKQSSALGAKLAVRLRAGDAVGLTGELGAGKTNFVQGMAKALGIEGYILSPTFTIINIYEAEVPLYHIDLYRIGEGAELEELGLEEYIYADGISVIEWVERAPEYMKDLRFHVSFTYIGEFERRIEIEERI